jgi:hypothetical protein
LPLPAIIGAVAALVLILYIISVVRHRPDSCASLCSWLRCCVSRAPVSKAQAAANDDAFDNVQTSAAKSVDSESDNVELIDIRIANTQAKMPATPTLAPVEAKSSTPLPATIESPTFSIRRKKSILPSAAAGLAEK